MDSQDQVERQSTIEQTSTVESATEQRNDSDANTVEVNGEQVSLDSNS